MSDAIYEDCIRGSESHHAKCRRRVAMTCAAPVECDHGYDCCPVCDPCTCDKEGARDGDK